MSRDESNQGQDEQPLDLRRVGCMRRQTTNLTLDFSTMRTEEAQAIRRLATRTELSIQAFPSVSSWTPGVQAVPPLFNWAPPALAAGLASTSSATPPTFDWTPPALTVGLASAPATAAPSRRMIPPAPTPDVTWSGGLIGRRRKDAIVPNHPFGTGFQRKPPPEAKRQRIQIICQDTYFYDDLEYPTAVSSVVAHCNYLLKYARVGEAIFNTINGVFGPQMLRTSSDLTAADKAAYRKWKNYMLFLLHRMRTHAGRMIGFLAICDVPRVIRREHEDWLLFRWEELYLESEKLNRATTAVLREHFSPKFEWRLNHDRAQEVIEMIRIMTYSTIEGGNNVPATLLRRATDAIPLLDPREETRMQLLTEATRRREHPPHEFHPPPAHHCHGKDNVRRAAWVPAPLAVATTRMQLSPWPQELLPVAPTPYPYAQYYGDPSLAELQYQTILQVLPRSRSKDNLMEPPVQEKAYNFIISDLTEAAALRNQEGLGRAQPTSNPVRPHDTFHRPCKSRFSQHRDWVRQDPTGWDDDAWRQFHLDRAAGYVGEALPAAPPPRVGHRVAQGARREGVAAELIANAASLMMPSTSFPSYDGKGKGKGKGKGRGKNRPRL